MTMSMYQASAPLLKRALKNLSAILDKAAAHAATKKIDPAVLAGDRLAPDMLPFPRQITIPCDTAKFAMARLAGVEAPKFEDNEKTFDEFKARIQKTIDFIDSIKPNQIDGTEDKPISFKAGQTELKFTGQTYLTHFVIPNFFFHVSMAYAILRHNGVDIGKLDFLGRE
jgi:uncharacterized protein